MWDDTIVSYLGREAEWAALCALDGLETGIINLPDPSEAPSMIEGVWEFVVTSCEEAGQAPPDANEAAKKLVAMIQEKKTFG